MSRLFRRIRVATSIFGLTDTNLRPVRSIKTRRDLSRERRANARALFPNF